MRYSRQIILPEVGPEGQQKLLDASVLMIGAGGLGCPVLLYMAAAGVGRIGIVDSDRVDVSNLQRQVLYSTGDEGRLKAETAAQKLNALNPGINIDVYPFWLSRENVLELFSSYDIIIDGSDNFPTRYLVNDACVLLNKPLVFGSIFKFEGQVSVFNYQNGPTYRCLFPEASNSGDVPNCSEIGVIGVLPGIIGTMQANEVIKIILGKGDVLSGTLLIYDALTNAIQKLKVLKDPVASVVRELGTYDDVCLTVPEITKAKMEEWKERQIDFQLIDVREAFEYERRHLGGTLIPLPEFSSRLGEVRIDIPVVIHCQAGIRSMKAAELLYAKGYKNIFNLKDPF